VSFDRKTITFRPNAHRRLKTGTSARVVPLWPQLEEILRAYVFGAAGRSRGSLGTVGRVWSSASTVACGRCGIGPRWWNTG
jgi:hypothetical protein